MGSTDFIDDDLVHRRSDVKEVKIGPARDAGTLSTASQSDTVPVHDLNLTPLTQRKEEINSRVATKLDELERLRSRLDSLEREKASLENLRANQEKYEAGKREMIDHLEQSLVTLDREQIQLNQRLELLADTEKRFKDMLGEVRGFNEEQWPTDSLGLHDALTKALVIVDDSRKEYNKALARIDALRESKSAGSQGNALMYGDLTSPAAVQRSFFDWMLLGLAVSVPLIVMLGILAVVLFLRTY